MIDGQLDNRGELAGRLVECNELVAAVWCPKHGDCTCDRDRGLEDPDCPLHSPESDHADGYSVDETTFPGV